jgi:uncharacterized NAD-dependent epimerase/dehydratase family protein
MISSTLGTAKSSSPSSRVRVGGISFNTGELREDQAFEIMAAESARLGLPVADPMRGGDEFERLVNSCLA